MNRPISDLLSRLLAQTASLTPSELAAAVGADAAYVRRWRGGYRPGRMGADLRERIIRYLAQSGDVAAEPVALRESSAALDPVSVAVGKFQALEQMAQEMARIAAGAGRELRASASGPVGGAAHDSAPDAPSEAIVPGEVPRPTARRVRRTGSG